MGADYGTQIVGNHFTGGTIYNDVYTGTAISLTASLWSASSGNGAFPLPAGWTALPNLGTVINQNTIQDSVGGIVIGVRHAVNYWEGLVVSSSETGREFLTASVTNNTFEFRLQLSQFMVIFLCCGRKQSRREFDTADRDHRQRFQCGGPWTLWEPAISLDDRQCHHRQQFRPIDLHRSN